MHRLRLAVLATTSLIAAPVFAQIAPAAIPGSARPDVAGRQYQIQEQRPDVSAAPQVIAPPVAGETQLKGDVSFDLRSVDVQGSTVYSEEDFAEFYQSRIGTRVTMADLNAIANAITAQYRNDGYILSRAVLPPQRIEGGRAVIRIVEGYVSDVSFQGEVDDRAGLLAAYGDKIKQSRPLNSRELERYLLLMEDLPGVNARAVLQPAASTGATQVVVNINRDPVEASAFINNRGSRFLGQYQLGLTAAANNLVGMEEQTLVRAVGTPFEPDELMFGEIRHEQQLGTEGTKLVLDANITKTEPGSWLEVFDIEGHDVAFDIALSHPILRSRQSNWFFNTDFAVRRSSVSGLDTNIYTDHTRVWTAGTAYDFIDETSAVNRLEGSFSKGFSWDAHPDDLVANSRGSGESSFLRFNANATRIQPLWGAFSASAAATAQYSFDPLLASEEFAIGGAEFGSAYDPAELTGDSGVAARFELQYNGEISQEIVPSYQLYGFYDIGKVWNRCEFLTGELNHASLASTGLGARFNILPRLSGDVEFALPLTRKVSANREDGAAPRVFFNLLYRY